ncbi:hypothetical protein DH2020_035223 [Rehmannia glutinosa]|uniref:Retrotransposon Copia-like N-terminal domain-containing protein n=1 Tax=Rehmannia glutinosa TaxID=99300 RepID=A0ABR0VAQ4_REHGL
MTSSSSSSSSTSSISSTSSQALQPLSQLITVKLNEGNYLLWKQQITAAVKGYGLEGFLTGEKQEPEKFLPESSTTTGIINPEYVNWIRQDQLIASWLLSSLSENLLADIVGLSTTREIWSCLETIFSSQTRAKNLHYREQLHSIRKGNQTMREFLSKIKGCVDALKATGEKISQEEHLMYIMSGLGSDYNSVMVSVTSKTEPISIAEVTSLLLTFEARLERIEAGHFGVEGSHHTVNIATQNSNFNRSPSNQFQRGRGSPYTGNRGRASFRGGSFRGRGKDNYHNSGGCQLCKRNNHTAERCYYSANPIDELAGANQATQHVPSHPMKRYIQGILEKTNMSGAKGTNTPMIT